MGKVRHEEADGNLQREVTLSHGITSIGSWNLESTLKTFDLERSNYYKRTTHTCPTKETYYDRRQQRVPPRSLLPGDLFGNGSASQALGL